MQDRYEELRAALAASGLAPSEADALLMLAVRGGAPALFTDVISAGGARIARALLSNYRDKREALERRDTVALECIMRRERDLFA